MLPPRLSNSALPRYPFSNFSFPLLHPCIEYPDPENKFIIDHVVCIKLKKLKSEKFASFVKNGLYLSSA